MKARPTLLLLALAVAGGCTTAATRQYRAAEEGKVSEAALLYELTLRDTNRLVFVSLFDSQNRVFDPPDNFVERLQAAGIPARKASQSSRDVHTRVVDKFTGEPGIIYSAGVLRWINNTKVVVRRGCDVANLAGGATDCVMEMKDGKWQETKTERSVIY
jgi:hypothetical protein